MKSFLYVSCSWLDWRLATNSAKRIKLKSVPGFELLNPYHFGMAYSEANLLRTGGSFIKDSVHISTKGLVLESINLKDNLTGEFWEQLNQFLVYLRYTSRQFTMRSEGTVSSIQFSPKIKLGKLNVCRDVISIKIRQDSLNSMITWDNVKSAEKLALNKYEIPVFEGILIDAVGDRNNGEYRKAILFSAIAVESFLARTYDYYYENIVSKKNKSNKYRFVEQNRTVQDPIYKALTDRTDFKKLLHEIPLYLFNKSLLESNKGLYDDALKLYATRNKIVHWGAPINSSQERVFEINRENAYRAVETAIDVFEWLGNNKFAGLKHSNFVEIKANNSGC